jgi:hypothetical protein
VIDADGTAGFAGDGTATRMTTCTSLKQQIGTAVDSDHGRLDGTLVYIVPQGGPAPQCSPRFVPLRSKRYGHGPGDAT